MKSMDETYRIPRLIKVSKRYTVNRVALEALKFHIASELDEATGNKEQYSQVFSLKKLLNAVMDLSHKMNELDEVIKEIEKGELEIERFRSR